MTRSNSITETAGTRFAATLSLKVEDAFKKYDKDGSGTLERPELRNLLSDLHMGSAEVQCTASNLMSDDDSLGGGRCSTQQHGQEWGQSNQL